jgi:hypothetical protein
MYSKQAIREAVKAELVAAFGSLNKQSGGQSFDVPYTILGVIEGALARLPAPATLQLVDPDKTKFLAACGITDERAIQIGDNLDKMAAGYAGQLVYVVDVINDILAGVGSLEEFTFALISHIEYRAARNFPKITHTR